MRLLVILSSSLILVNSLIYTAAGQRLERDINVLRNQYFPPLTKTDLSKPENIQESSVLAKDAYVNNMVHKLHYPKGTHVSHLDLAYLLPLSSELKTDLPPIEVNPRESSSLSNEYLPPSSVQKNAENVTETTYNPPIMSSKTEAEVELKPARPSNNLLPPLLEAKMTKVPTELPPSFLNEYLPPDKMSDEYLEKPLSTLAKANEDIEIGTIKLKQQASEEPFGAVVEAQLEVPRDIAIQEVDSYYYQIPDNISKLFPTITSFKKYLPPLEEGIIEAEGPANGESSLLEKDGYHYRVIKCRF